MRVRLVVLALLGLVLAVDAAPVRAEPPIEYQLQAAYVAKFLRFVEWPEGVVEGGRFVVGVVGGSEYWEAMQEMDGHEFGSSRVSVRRLKSPAALEGVHVLVCDPERPSPVVGRFLRAAANRPILTVGQSSGFAEAGGMIRFVVVDDSLRFEIDTAAARGAGLKLSSRLLRVGRNVRSSP